MYGKDQKAAIKEESEKSKKGLGNCLSGQYWIVKQEKKERRKISTRRLSQGAITGNNEENAMKFAERRKREGKRTGRLSQGAIPGNKQ